MWFCLLLKEGHGCILSIFLVTTNYAKNVSLCSCWDPLEKDFRDRQRNKPCMQVAQATCSLQWNEESGNLSFSSLNSRPKSDSSHVFPSWLSDPYKLRVFIQPIKSQKHERGNSQHIAFLNQIYRFLQESSIWCGILFLPNSNALHSRDSFEEIIITFSCFSFTFPRQTLFLAFFFFSRSCNITKTFLVLLLLCTRVASPASCNSIGESDQLPNFLISKLYCKGIRLRPRCRDSHATLVKEFDRSIFLRSTDSPLRVIKWNILRLLCVDYWQNDESWRVNSTVIKKLLNRVRFEWGRVEIFLKLSAQDLRNYLTSFSAQTTPLNENKVLCSPR